jgi:transketolase
LIVRNTFIQELVKQARAKPNIALIVGDLGYSVVEPFADEFPDRFINAGVAEQNMTGLAAGMASEGYHVFTYSIANFPTFRCAEQIRNDVAYHNLPVTVVTVGGGLAYGALGYSHHAVQDYALMRSFPGMLIASPGDPFEVSACMDYLVANPSPSYLRIGKAGEPNFNTGTPELCPGDWNLVKGADKSRVILTTGGCLGIAFEWAKQDPYKNHSIYTMPLWSMESKAKQKQWLGSVDHLVVIEDHLVDGGFGSWMLESQNKLGDHRCRIELKALDSMVCGSVGAQSMLNRLGGIAPR